MRNGEQFAALDRGLKEAGFVEDQNVKIEYRWANNDYSGCALWLQSWFVFRWR